ncbi:MAG: S8 family serine peptidase [Candidatus Aminicenantes bacterium]|nr:S8 family serine peptidase [Candidatus Aminicenantes bacterium]
MKKIIFLLLPIIVMITLSTTLPGEELSTYEKLLNTAREKGSARIIILLDVKNLEALTEKSTQYKVIEPGLSFPAAGVQADLDLRQAVDTAAYSVLYQLNGKDYRLNHTYSTLPYLALEVSPETLALLPTLPQVLDIFEDKARPLADYHVEEKKPLEKPFAGGRNDGLDRPMLTSSIPLIGANTAWSMGYTGAGWYVAILDTGIRRTHEFFAGKTILEACFSTNADCPNGTNLMIGPGAAAHYESNYYGYDHGTHVSGIAAGKTNSLKGVAKDSKILAVQVFSRFSAADCGGDSDCVMSWDSDQTKGLEHVYSLRSTYSIAAVNMSLGGGEYNLPCTGEPQQAAMNNLKAVRIATAVATGNEGYCDAVSSPACIPAAVAVGASNDSDIEAGFNNWSETLQELFAPGVGIYSSTGESDSSYESWSGTSMATPHVTGAWALLRQASSSSSVDEILAALQKTGPAIDTLCGGGGSCPRIEVDDAIDRLLGNTDSITVTAPNGGEKWGIGSTYAVAWTSSGAIDNVKIEYSTDNGARWSTIVASTKNTGSYNWTIPNKPSIRCKVRIGEAVDGRPSDTCNSTFSIVTVTNPTLTVTTPNGGEKWDAATVHNITWTSTGSVGNVKIEYSSNNGGSWNTVFGSTANNGSYSWTLPTLNSTACKVRIGEASDGSPTDTSNAVFSIIIPLPPEISLNRAQFYYGAIAGGAVTGAQTLRIDNNGGGTLQWTALANTAWIIAAPASGTDSGESALSAVPGALAVGTYTGSVTVAAPGATNTPQTVNAQLTIKDAAQDEAPFGSFDTPVDGSTVRGSFALTGWALDDVGVASVKIYRQDNENLIYIGDALLVEGARPDVEALYPTMPRSYQAGWGYMLLSYFLPDGGNGVYVLTAIATDLSGKQTTLGSKTVTVDNANAVKPFGAIDNPAPGGEASGSNFRNSGWALTPLPNMIPIDGSTMSVYIDGVNKGRPTYNIYRADIAGLFPDYLNSGGAHAYFIFDMTTLENGIHTIAWTATDNAGNAEGIGSRYFIVQNTGADMDRRGEPPCSPAFDSYSPISDRSGAVGVIKGYRENAAPQAVYPDGNGIISIEIKELERVEIHFPASPVNNVSPLPIGSTLDREKGIFYWNPGPGFIGNYQLEFTDNSGNHSKRLKIKILPGQ